MSLPWIPPWQPTVTSFEAINMVIEGLETTDPEHNIVPALAESYDVSDDELTYTFHLRDAEWSNGDPVTAADFEYAWKDTISRPDSGLCVPLHNGWRLHQRCMMKPWATRKRKMKSQLPQKTTRHSKLRSAVKLRILYR